MQRKIIFVGLLLTALYGLVSTSPKFFYVNQTMTWSEAQSYCRKDYTDLSFINNQDTADRLSRISQKSWIGLYRNNVHLDWRWSGGRGHLPYRLWASLEPNNMATDEHCVMMSDGLGYDVPCDNTYTFFCYTELVLVTENKTWEEALEHCRDQHRDLASLRSEADHLLAQNISSEAQTSQVWTGLRFLAGYWLWVNGDVLEYQAWSGGGAPLCPALHLRCGTLAKVGEHWGTWDCQERLNFLCFRKL